MAPPYQISDWYGSRHICHTAFGDTLSSTPTITNDDDDVIFVY